MDESIDFELNLAGSVEFAGVLSVIWVLELVCELSEEVVSNNFIFFWFHY